MRLGRGLYAKLAPHMIAEADYVAHQRRENAIKEKLKPGNNLKVTPDENLLLDILGTRGERAAKIVFDPIKWLAFEPVKSGSKKKPDLGDFIDVKAQERTMFDDRLHELNVSHDPKKNITVNPDWAYLLVGAETHPYYWIAGWMWGHEVMRFGELRNPSRPYYSVRVDRLHPPWRLIQIARERNPIHEEG
jgi:hypothetical protein